MRLSSPIGASRPLRLGLPRGRFLTRSLAFLSDLVGAQVDASSRRSNWSGEVGGRRLDVKLMKSQDIAGLLASHDLDFGIVSDEWLADSGAQVVKLTDLNWCRTWIVLAAPARQEADPRWPRRIATSYPAIAADYLRRVGAAAEIKLVAGTPEALVPDVCDAIVDCVETGKSLVENDLEILAVLVESSVWLTSRQGVMSAATQQLVRTAERHRRPSADLPPVDSAVDAILNGYDNLLSPSAPSRAAVAL